jgi:hypothetical protein
MGVPKSLKTWFTIHFFIDYVFGIPLLFVPAWTLGLFGFDLTVGGVLTARLVGAALIGIGGISLLHKKSKDVYQTLLDLKLIWSSAAILGILITLIQTGEKILWLFLGLFMGFFLLWGWYRTKVHHSN